MQVQLERFGDFLGNKAARRAAVDAPYQLAAQEAVGQRVVDAAAAGWPKWRHGGQRIDHPLPVEDVVIGHGGVQAVQPGLVRHHLVHRDGAFALSRELRPVAGHGRGVVELAAIGQHRNCQRHHALAHGPDVDQRVSLPGRAMVQRAVPTPEVDHRLAIHHHGQCRA